MLSMKTCTRLYALKKHLKEKAKSYVIKFFTRIAVKEAKKKQ